MANGQTGGRRGAAEAAASTQTRKESVGVWGRTIAAQVLRGDSVLQNRHNLPHPRTLPTADVSGNGQANRTAPNRFHGMNSVILRTLSAQRGIEDPTFALAPVAQKFNDMHGDKEKPVKANAKQIELPAAATNADDVRRVNREVKLSEDGPNYNSFGEEVQGKTGDKQRNDKGNIVQELVDVEGSHRAQGTKVYYHRDDLNLPHLEARERPRPEAREYLLANTLGANRRFNGLDVDETKDLAGRAELSMQPAGTKVGDQTLEKDTYTLRVGPEDTFASVDHHRSAVTHELSRFSMCRDGNADALAVAQADPAEREKMPEFARSELAASAATIETVTDVGHEYHPPSYARENERDIRQTQAEHLRQPDSLSDVGRQAHRAERMNHNNEPTAYDQGQRNYERRQASPRVEDAARGFATRGARPMARAAAVPDPSAPTPEKAAPAQAASDKDKDSPKPARQSGRTASAVQDAAAAATGGRRGTDKTDVPIGAQAKEPAAGPAQASGAAQQPRARGKGKAEDAGGGDPGGGTR